MFTDIVGYSRMMQLNEERASVVRNRHREVFREMHEKHGGKILQYYGDGTLSIFDSAVAAVECAVEMQEGFKEEPKVPLRIGIHTGDITYEDEGAFGDGLNIAARIEPLCVPGGVYISGKVYDDIKNHPWLEARSLGPQRLKNILHDVEIYAVTSKGLPAPEERPRDVSRTYSEPKLPPFDKEAGILPEEKQKKTAALLALILGAFGAHRFYLGQRRRGITYLIFGLLGVLSGGDAPFLPIMAIIGVIDAVLLFTMSQETFDQRYNGTAGAGVELERRAPSYARERVYRREQEAQPNPFKRSGVRKFRAGDYDSALADFRKALEINDKDMAVHFNLACCYSIMQDAEKSLSHLSKAVEYGFWDLEKIHNHEALTYLRNTDGYANFVKNDYQLIRQLPLPGTDLLDTEPNETDLLDQIATLGDLMERGVITREEFDEQKRKLLGEE